MRPRGAKNTATAMPVETLPYVYATQQSIENLYSAAAVLLRGDDNDDGTLDAGLLTDVIDTATDTTNFYILPLYEASRANDNLWVRSRTTLIACWLLSQRKGDAAQFQTRYERVMAELEQVNKMQHFIPRLPLSSNLAPGVSNYHVDDRYVIAKTRVQQTISSGGRSERQHVDRRYIVEPVLP